MRSSAVQENILKTPKLPIAQPHACAQYLECCELELACIPTGTHAGRLSYIQRWIVFSGHQSVAVVCCQRAGCHGSPPRWLTTSTLDNMFELP